MVLPRWIPFLVAAWVIAFGLMRLRIATRKEEDENRPNFRKGGYYARSRRSHAIYGIAYLLLGCYCVAMGFGYQIDITGGCMSKQGQTQTQESVPSEAVPVEVSQ